MNEKAGLVGGLGLFCLMVSKEDMTRKKLIIFIVCLVLAVLLYFWLRPVGRLQVRLGLNGPEFLDQGWTKNAYYKIEVRNGKWGWWKPDGYWVELPTPYEEVLREGNWNLVLETDGKIYQVKKDKLERMELKVVDRDWYQKLPTGEWQKLDDF